MENKKTVEMIRAQYTERQTTKVDELTALDRKAKLPAQIFAYSFGVVAALILGVGMCFAMEVLTIPYGMAIGIVIGVVGLGLCGVNYLIYKALIKKGKAKYGEQILALSKEILGE
ncbi:MAG: dihydropteridine reductase [Clostridia bacterium]|nr:dihydropteridine reductase [Clostridia bacterium]